jgi:hypothetical protein
MNLKSIALGFSLLAAACQTIPTNRVPDEATTVRVDNRSFADMDVFAVRSGQRVRLGMASGNKNTVFQVPASLVSGVTQLRFVADPIGSSRASITEEVSVSPGDEVLLVIPPG